MLFIGGRVNSFIPRNGIPSAAPIGTTVGRLAPSPTGRMHLGNLWSFFLAWLDVRGRGGKLHLRIENIDPARSRSEYENMIIDDLNWFGLDWDGPVIRQSERGNLYETALKRLGPLVYPCFCTRKELRDMAGAPQANRPETGRIAFPDAGAPYPGICRRMTASEREHKKNSGVRASFRLMCPPFTANDGSEAYGLFSLLASRAAHYPEYAGITDGIFTFDDRILGMRSISLAEIGGDFALRRSDGVWAYQLAAVADDIAMGVTSVVRGADILSSVPRQLYLSALLGAAPPRYSHIPLLLTPGGERLAKRHTAGDSPYSLASVRSRGSSPKDVLNFLMSLAGISSGFMNPGSCIACAKDVFRSLKGRERIILPEKLPF